MPTDAPTPPPARDSKRIENNTVKYNILNAMQYPKLYGVQQTTIPKTSGFIQTVLDNVDNYAIGYPLGGRTMQRRPDGTQVPTEQGMFYTGADLSLGSNYFIPLGKCGQGSDPQCVGKNKMVYLRNIPTGYIPLLGNVSMYSITGCDIEGVTNGLGTVPGMLEDLSEFADIGGPNIVGDTCRRIRLPVGSKIYDSQMQCNLDYAKINSKPTLQGRLQETHRQVQSNCGDTGENNNTWWYEEHCTPSYNNAVHPSLLNPLNPNTNHESVYIPMPKPLANVEQTTTIPNIPEQFHNKTRDQPTTHESMWNDRCKWVVGIVIVAVLLVMYIAYHNL